MRLPGRPRSSTAAPPTSAGPPPRDGGTTCERGSCPGITSAGRAARTPRVSDPSVAYDAAHNVWLISSLPLVNERQTAARPRQPLDRRRARPGAPGHGRRGQPGSDLDKNWTVCDNTPRSPFYGNCYTEWDDNGDGNRIKMSTSTDGGLTWSAPSTTAGNATGHRRPAARAAQRHRDRADRRTRPRRPIRSLQVDQRRRELERDRAGRSDHPITRRRRRPAHRPAARPPRSTATARSTSPGRTAASAPAARRTTSS